MTSPHKIDKFSCIKMKNFHLSKDTIKNEKTSHRVGENICNAVNNGIIKNDEIRKRQKNGSLPGTYIRN